ncbi:amidase [Pseudoclavibacter sp. 13-3]|uniref:amidase n=1 Tax=Pseudoclavibacter sp. 13-3 TaxID=2901228 RepID=UPI0022B24155|nr:amidase [Pseudoclavibacter sp. 13-3]
MNRFDVVEKSISELLTALENGEVTSVDIVCAYLNRIAYYDRTGICLHAVPVINPDCLREAAASDRRRRAGDAGPLEGVPFTIKDSYKARGLTVASGSPALADLVATEDAASVAQLRAAGAVLLGKTNMPPMAAGGVQPGVYDYARSPYHPEYLTAAYGSGSSNGSGTATGASMCAFGMGEETVSSGRSPASNNALVAYTPSRGVLSLRGNWPLRPTCDVVVPHTRSVHDLTLLLDVLAVKDPETVGDFWREQHVVELPAPEDVLHHPVSRDRPTGLDGQRIGVPKMYIGEDSINPDAPAIRASVRELWDRAADDLRALGAEVVEVDFPVVSNYEEDRPGAQGLPARGLVPDTWRAIEGDTLTAMALDSFLRVNGDPNLSSWADVDGDSVFPLEDEPVPLWVTRTRGGFDWQRLAEFVKQGLPAAYDDVPGITQLLTGLEQARRDDLEQWMADEHLDLIVFPAAGDVGRDDLFQRPESLAAASRNGVAYSNGNRVLRHLGIPTVTVPMGVMSDIRMPVGLTFAGPAYSDDRLLDAAAAYEQATQRREPAFLTPTVTGNQIETMAAADIAEPPVRLEHSVLIEHDDRFWIVEVVVSAFDAHGAPVPARAAGAEVWADGHRLRAVPGQSGVFRDQISLRRDRLDETMLILVKDGHSAASFDIAPLPADC